jgi:GntR family transcriptional regulator
MHDDGATRVGPDFLSQRLPKYLQIHQKLTEQILAGEYPSGAMLPAQRELAKRFGVTPMTVRQALRTLERDGLVVTRHGTGSIVQDPSFTYGLGRLTSLGDDLRARGMPLTSTVLGIDVGPGPVGVLTRLALPPDAEVLTIRRMRSAAIGDPAAEPRPLLLQTSHLPTSIGTRLKTDELTHRSLYSMLAEDLGIRVERADETVQAAILGVREARLLQRRRGAPALLSRRLSRTGRGEPVIDDRAILPGDVAVIRADRRIDYASIHYDYSPDTRTE